jgi:hypothetical protein
VPLFSARNAGGPAAGGPDQPTSDDDSTVDQVGSIMAAQYATQSVRFDDQQARDGLAGSSINCPPVDGDVVARYLSFFVRTGFVGAPAAPSRTSADLIGR